jgi:hypothetical protein
MLVTEGRCCCLCASRVRTSSTGSGGRGGFLLYDLHYTEHDTRIVGFFYMIYTTQNMTREFSVSFI